MTPTVAAIQQAVARRYRVPVRVMTSPSRLKEFVIPRHVAMYLIRELTPRSFNEIGAKFGGRDHCTVIKAIKSIERKSKIDGDLAANVQALRKVFANSDLTFDLRPELRS